MTNQDIFNPYYNKINGVTIGFMLSVMFCSKIEEIDRKIIYILYIANIIPHEFLKEKRNSINYDYLLQLIFKLSKNKKLVKLKDLREITSLTSSETFDKHFGTFLEENNLKKRRVFTFPETYKILKFWQGSDKIGRIEAYTKNELALRFFNGNYDNLEIQYTNHLNNGDYNTNVFNIDYYKNTHYLKPDITIQFLTNLLESNTSQELDEDLFEKKAYLLIFLGFLVADSIK